ncbi:hypothetical protein AAG570_006930 [Ranatra chinensis]|uniref:Uncharacterized protein n=1 Tax=Ranatra chinensis TaxID=642074 RepID=A0ABD0YVH5_9HEMI
MASLPRNILENTKQETTEIAKMCHILRATIDMASCLALFPNMFRRLDALFNVERLQVDQNCVVRRFIYASVLTVRRTPTGMVWAFQRSDAMREDSSSSEELEKLSGSEHDRWPVQFVKCAHPQLKWIPTQLTCA